MIGAPVVISHDAFARESLVRRREERIYSGDCAWCGARARFRYGVQRDDRPGLIAWDDHLFCSLSCRNAHTH